MSATTYPVRVDASLDTRLSRWLWLVKWILVIPHYFILAFLWIAFAVLSVVAFVAILCTGHYPRAIFDFNVGVLRWWWRVQYYAYGALGTDRYPPFSLKEVPDYPAHLEIAYPERLSRGLVLVKWWLLAIPQYIIVGLFAGGGTFGAWWLGNRNAGWSGGGLIGILVLIAAVILAFTGRYPDTIFDFVLGMNRWVLRVAAYAGLMTDQYPPFRLDTGGHEPGGTLTLQPPASPAAEIGGTAELPGVQDAMPPAGPAEPGLGWTVGRVVSAVIGSVLVLSAAGFLAGGAGLTWAGHARREGGFVTSTSASYSTADRALVSDTIQLPAASWNWLGKSVIGQVRLRVTASDPSKPVFVGIAQAAAVSRYLSGAGYTTLTNLGGRTTAVSHQGTAVPAAPASTPIWTVHAVGTGTQALVWTPAAGNWTVVVMNPNATPGLSVQADAGATMPGLSWITGFLLIGGLLLMAGGVLLIVISVRLAS